MNNSLVYIMTIDNVDLLVEKANCKWYIKTGKGLFDFSSENHYVPLLNILYIDPALFFNKLKILFEVEGVPESCIKDFPISELLFFCIRNKMHFWTRLFFKWLSYIELTQEQKELILHIQKQKYPQDIRHTLFKAAFGKNRM